MSIVDTWFMAIKHRDIYTVKTIIEQGFDINTDIIYGHDTLPLESENRHTTALMYASQWGFIDIVKILIDKGADINIRGLYGNTALTFATQSGFVEIVKILIDNGAELNIKDDGGYTALMYASMDGYIDIAIILIEKGADINIKDGFGNTALKFATENRHIEIVRLSRGVIARQTQTTIPEPTVVKPDHELTYEEKLLRIGELIRQL